MTSTASLVGRTIGHFTITAHVGDGGMGSVYRCARHGWPGPLAIKVLLPIYAQDPEFRTRFVREGALLSQMSHPHIIPVYTYGEDGDHLFFVMRYINGVSVWDLMQRRRFTPVSVWQILRPVASALDYAHERETIHRDIKPSNILIEVRESDGKVHNHVYLADFGLSKVLSWTTLTQSGISVGTPQYMSPEQVLDHPLTPASDVYALAVVVYELLLGRLPFYARRPDQVAFRHVDTSPPIPTRLHYDFPPALEAVLLRALSKTAADRYQTAGEFSAAYAEAMGQLTPAQRRAEYYVGPPEAFA